MREAHLDCRIEINTAFTRAYMEVFQYAWKVKSTKTCPHTMIDSYGLGIIRTASTRGGFHSRAGGAIATGFDQYMR